MLHIRLALVSAVLLPISALLATVIGPIPLYIGFLVSGVATGSIFMSYQNWLINYTTPEQRSLYTGLFNTLSAVIALLTPLIGGMIAQEVGYEILFVVALVMGLGALYVAVRHLPNPVTQG